MVEDAGYTPLEALDTDEALAILSSRSDIALVCADIQLPGSMDGIGLAHTVRSRWPAIDVILMSEQLNPPSIDLPLAASSMVSRSRLGRSKLGFVG
ncbi:response regulator [Bradyrhizobium japonicum]|uniref:response regulator n=1 Tax=Bradyrhizobium japonicum TaxID=375 RepID=UPI0002E7D0B8|nr:response regulator [Bradyrhizobium japonicum]